MAEHIGIGCGVGLLREVAVVPSGAELLMDHETLQEWVLSLWPFFLCCYSRRDESQAHRCASFRDLSPSVPTGDDAGEMPHRFFFFFFWKCVSWSPNRRFFSVDSSEY